METTSFHASSALLASKSATSDHSNTADNHHGVGDDLQVSDDKHDNHTHLYDSFGTEHENHAICALISYTKFHFLDAWSTIKKHTLHQAQ